MGNLGEICSISCEQADEAGIFNPVPLSLIQVPCCDLGFRGVNRNTSR